MSWIDVIIATSVFAVFVTLSLNYFLQGIDTKVWIAKLIRLEGSLSDYAKTLFESEGIPPNWTSDDFVKVGLLEKVYRIPIVVKNTLPMNLSNEVIDLKVSIDDGCELIARNSSLRLVDEDLNEIEFGVYNATYCSGSFLKEVSLVILLNISAGEVKELYLYFSPNEKIPPANFSTNLTFNESTNTLQNSMIKLKLGGEVVEVYDLANNSQNLLAGRRLGIVQFNETTGTLVETSEGSGSVSVVVDSPFKKVLLISGSTSWYDYEFEVTLYPRQDYFILKPYLKEKLNVTLHDFKFPEMVLSQSFGNVSYRNGTQGGFQNSSETYGNVEGCYWIAPRTQGSKRMLALVTTDPSAWKSCGWNASSKEISFSMISEEYDSGSILVNESDEFSGSRIFVKLFDSAHPEEVETFWKKVFDPPEVKVLPREETYVLSATKLQELKESDYEKVKNSLGAFEFSILIEEP